MEMVVLSNSIRKITFKISKCYLHAIVSTFFVCCSLNAETSPAKIRTLYNSLDQNSVAQQLAFYELYGNTQEGKLCLRQAWRLLSGGDANNISEIERVASLQKGVGAIVGLVNKPANQSTSELSCDELNLIQKLAGRLQNRKLRGFQVRTEEEVLQLPPEEIDLARGLFLSQLGDDANAFTKCRSYESLIDLMALQILTRIHSDATPEEKIRAINNFIFDEMGFRFPPHSEYADEIDVYTFLPSVLDSRRGVCLGVSILYIALAQRLDLELEMITPPGHIYVRYRKNGKEINIETTARGVHIDSEEYLGIETRSLQKRNVKEVIGLAHFNQASTHWAQERYDQALASYLRAQKFLPNDMLLKELMGYQYLFTGNVTEGRRLLEEVKDHIPDYGITRDTTAEDYLNGFVNEEGIKTVYMHVDENRISLLEKKDALEKMIRKYPRFRTGLFHLAVAWLQLHREKEALQVLERYHLLDSIDPTAEYYMTVLYATRLDYNQAWFHMNLLTSQLKSRQHNPKLLKSLHRELSQLSPL